MPALGTAYRSEGEPVWSARKLVPQELPTGSNVVPPVVAAPALAGSITKSAKARAIAAKHFLEEVPSLEPFGRIRSHPSAEKRQRRISASSSPPSSSRYQPCASCVSCTSSS